MWPKAHNIDPGFTQEPREPRPARLRVERPLAHLTIYTSGLVEVSIIGSSEPQFRADIGSVDQDTAMTLITQTLQAQGFTPIEGTALPSFSRVFEMLHHETRLGNLIDHAKFAMVLERYRPEE